MSAPTDPASRWGLGEGYHDVWGHWTEPSPDVAAELAASGEKARPSFARCAAWAEAQAAGSDWWVFKAFRELDDCLLRLRLNHDQVGLVLLKTRGAVADILATDATLEALERARPLLDRYDNEGQRHLVDAWHAVALAKLGREEEAAAVVDQVERTLPSRPAAASRGILRP